jgi:alpha-beta hydrolase superfamily lysophospholipase
MKLARLRLRPALAAGIVLLGTAASGCAIFGRYDMARIHRETAQMPRNPVIVVPGLMGSRLRHARTGKPAWGSLSNILWRGDDDLALPIDRTPLADNRDSLVAYDVIESAAGVKFYGAILDVLRDAGGYIMGDIADPKPGETLFVYYYDWRRDNVEAAIGLGRAVERVRAALGSPDLRVDIVAHSMGGLIAEYYLKYGAADVLDGDRTADVTWAGAAHLGRLVLIGTPRRGSMSAFRMLHLGLSRLLSPRVVFTMPALYQLLPQDPWRFVDERGAPVRVDLMDAAAWERHGWSVFNPRLRREDDRGARLRFLEAALRRAQAFRDALGRDAGPSPVPVHLFGSDCVPTLDRAVLHRTPDGTETRFEVNGGAGLDPAAAETLLLAPGDGSVTAASLLALDPVGLAAETPAGAAPGAAPREGAEFTSSYFFCETHGLLPSNRAFQDNLFYVLLYGSRRPAPSAGRLSGAGPAGFTPGAPR